MKKQQIKFAGFFTKAKYTEIYVCIIWASSWENLFLPYANNKGTDQPAHPRSLISTFVVHSLDSIISVVAID